VAAATVVALAIWVLARVLGVELTVGKGHDASPVGAAEVVVAVVLAGLAAWGVHGLLARRRAAGWWPFVGSTALSVSIIGPTWLADGAATVVLIGMHLAVGVVLIAGFNKSVSAWTSRSRPLHHLPAPQRASDPRHPLS